MSAPFSASTEPSRPRALIVTYALVFALAGACAGVLLRRSGLALFAALAGLGAWGVLVAVASVVPRLPWRLRGALFALGALAAAAIPMWVHLPRGHAFFAGAPDSLLQLAAVIFAVLAFGFHFLATYGAQVERTSPALSAVALAKAEPVLRLLVPLARLLAAAHVLALVVLLARLYAQRNWLSPVELALDFMLAALLVEAALHALFRFYSPAGLRASAELFGRSVLLPTLFGESGPLRALAAPLEKTFGVKLADAWLVRLARVLAAPLALLGVLGLWASTAVTRVPIEGRGVLVVRGEFQPAALPPGLHFHAPWPWARVEIVATERVQEFALGFERDLAGPVLWAEKHFEGEQNLLVGQGEELLTINVPIHYRVRDPVAFLRRTGDARAALEALGYRELLAITATHTAFGLMTTDRDEITAKLRTGLQSASDRLGLGLEIVFVGLKDVHPPVPVAPAYQDVVSAEEEQAALVDHARSYAVNTLSNARITANWSRLGAEALATDRRARAVGESARFLAPLAAFHASPEVFTTRLRLETLESALADVRSLLLVPASARPRANFFLGADASTLPFALAPTLTR